MNRSALTMVAVVLLTCVLGPTVAAQLEPFDGFTLQDMHLISQESLPHWTPDWTGPIQAATILAMLSELGHPDLLPDLNGDGVIDELDTIELADRFGLGSMRTETDRGTNDVRLVIGLAEYVAARYPGEFVLKIYDEGFPAEFRAETGNPFDPGAIHGILLQLMGEPTLDGYKVELETLEGVLVGLEEDRGGNNTYLSGRSLLFEATPQGYTPVDLAWAAEDRWAPGHQGQVLETVGRMAERMLVEYRGDWTPVEFMLALSPWDRPEISDSPYSCPPDAVAYDVTTSSTPYGDVEVEECVERDDGVDTYTWTVTNIDFLVDGCGICFFAVPNPGLPILDHDEPAGVAFSPSPSAYGWFAHLGSCGILPGNSGVFSVSVPGPTTDVPVPGAVGGCVPAAPPCGLALIAGAGIRTTGPARLEDCPDLVATIDDVSCVYEAVAGAAPIHYKLTVSLYVANVGGAPVPVPTTVRLRGLGPFSGSVADAPVPPLGPGSLHAATLSFTVTADAPPCPLGFRVLADAEGDVAECDEDNDVTGETCCAAPPDGEIGACCLPTGACVDVPESECVASGGDFRGIGTTCATVVCDEEGCPDLIIDIIRVGCDCSYSDKQYATYSFDVTARVTNIGTASSPPTDAHVSPGGDSAGVSGLAPGMTDLVHFSFESTGGRMCEEIEVTIVVEVDPVPGECDVDNNDDGREVDCR